MIMQVADVHKALGSVGKMRDRGNVVACEKEGGHIFGAREAEMIREFIENIKDRSVKLVRKRGAYVFNIMVKINKRSGAQRR